MVQANMMVFHEIHEQWVLILVMDTRDGDWSGSRLIFLRPYDRSTLLHCTVQY